MAKIFFLMGVSGSGKTTVLKESGILDSDDIIYVPSYTDRPLRPGEVNGQKYHHITKEEFFQGVEAGEFLEYAYGNSVNDYGTKLADILAPLAAGKHAIKEIETAGLLKIIESEKIDDTYVTIFLDISNEVMEERIKQRGGDDEEVQRRTAKAEDERVVAREYCDYIIDASQPLENVIEACIHIIDSYDL